jgi:hypothetical protein
LFFSRVISIAFCCLLFCICSGFLISEGTSAFGMNLRPRPPGKCFLFPP